jgi:Cu-Zn family superoxide dismutase
MRLHPSARRTRRRAAPALAAAALVAGVTACAAGGAPGGPPGRQGAPGARGGPAPGPTFETRNVAPARAEIRDADGRTVGQATFTQGPFGVLVTAELTGLPAGVHAMHIHEVGRCEPPFTAAGGHYNPLFRQHGFLNRAGFHAGDLPNFTAPATGTVRVDATSSAFQLGAGVGTLFDADGSSIMIHSAADDYKSDPGGNAGTRVACGVITRSAAAAGAATPGS